MALDVDVIEEPGTGLPVSQCPYCSRGYPHSNGEGERIDVPNPCRRCGAPMDYEAVHKPGGYADKQAEAASKAPPRQRRNRMVREPAGAKG